MANKSIFQPGNYTFFAYYPKMAGTTGALFGSLQDLSAAIASGLIACLRVQDQRLLAVLFISLGVLSIISWKSLSAFKLTHHIK